MKTTVAKIFSLVMAASLAAAAQNSNVIQIDVSPVLNARAVATFTRGKIIPLTADVDGAGGLVTAAVAEKLGNPHPHPLPDDGRFPATEQHPAVRLHFSNEDGRHNQIRRSEGEDEFSFRVPERNYTKLFLFLSSGHFGPAKIEVQLSYGDGTTDTRKMEVPDWYFPLPPGDPDRCQLAANLGKWNRDNQMIEQDHHFIYGLEVHPAPGKAVSGIKVRKFGSCVLAFWGATGVTAPQLK